MAKWQLEQLEQYYFFNHSKTLLCNKLFDYNNLWVGFISSIRVERKNSNAH
jgi:hypothetical protein